MADERGWRVNTPHDAERRGGTVSGDMPYADQVCAKLLKRDVVEDYRPQAGVHFSPHFYHTGEERAQASEAVDQILRQSRSPLGWSG